MSRASTLLRTPIVAASEYSAHVGVLLTLLVAAISVRSLFEVPNLEDVAKQFASRGSVYRVEPEVFEGKACFNVLVRKPDGTAEQLKVAMPRID